MSEAVSFSRRRALQLLYSAPVLPLASSFAGLSFVAEAEASGKPANFRFGAMAAPSLADPPQMATTYVASTLTKSDGPHQSETYKLGYETFFLTGARVSGTDHAGIIAGGYFDIHNAPIIDTTSADKRQFFSDCPDGMSLIALPKAKSHKLGQNRLFAVVQFEYTTKNAAGDSMYGKLPSPIAVLSLDQDARTGKLSLTGYYNVDTRETLKNPAAGAGGVESAGPGD